MSSELGISSEDDNRYCAAGGAFDQEPSSRRPHILILVENLSVPADRRVWQESRALVGAGYDVSVICPAGPKHDREREIEIDGVHIWRYPLRPAAGGPLGYPREYLIALFHSLRLAFKIRWHRPIDIVQACNPPDVLFIVAVALRPFGARFVFDHHDLVPELLLSRFPGKHRILHWLTRKAERLTFAVADAAIATNDSYRQIAIERGKMPPDRVVVVRSAPDLRRFQRQAPDQDLRRGKTHLLAYLGVMGPQDGVDYALQAIFRLKCDIGRNDFHCAFLGAGDSMDALVALSKELGIDDVVEFTGWADDKAIQSYLSSADVCLSPDPMSPLNDVSTMNKIVEYMAMGRPLVTFDLREARVSAADAAVYVPANDVDAFAVAINDLLNDPDRRTRMGEIGRQRVVEKLSWDASERELLDFYAKLTGRARDHQARGH